MKKTIQISALLLLCLNLSAKETVRDTLGFYNMGAQTPADLLKGKISGLRVSAADGGLNGVSNTTIRGINSLRSSSEPLWIVDGTILTSSKTMIPDAFWQSKYDGLSFTSETNPLSFINVYDIESIEVLKDATATSIYGSQGANGVIIIKTKLPEKDGQALKLNSNFGLGNNASFSHNHDLSFSSRKGNNSYRISGFIRSNRGAFDKESNFNGGVSVNFEARANKVVWFGLKSSLGLGKASSLSSTNWYPEESAMRFLRTGGINSSYNSDYDDNTQNYHSVNNVWLRLNLLNNLNWTTDFGADYDNTTRYVWYGNGTSLGALKNGAAAITTSACLAYNLSSKLTYNVYVAKHHHINAVAGVETSGNIDRFNIMNGSDFFSHELRAHGLSYNGDNVIIHKFDSNISRFGITGKLSYDFKGIFGLDASLRADNTRRYDDNSFIKYPAIEAWVKISSFKASAGYGKSGREYYFPEFAPASIQEGTESLYEGMSRVISGEWHVGIEADLFKNRFSAGAKFFEKKSSDTFNAFCFGTQVDETIRWKESSRSTLFNYSSSLRNRGIELDLSGAILKSRDFDWTINANVCFLSNQILSIDEQDRYSPALGGDIVSNYNEVGFAANSIIGYKLDGSGDPMDQTGDGLIGPEDRVILGQTSPSIFGGINTTFRWRALSVFAAVDGACGQKILNMNAMAADSADGICDKYVERGDFLRLGKLGVSYTFPLQKKWIRSVKVSLSGNNLLTATSYSGYNPDVDCFSKLPGARGIDYGSFPIYKSGILGVSIIF